MSAESKKRCRCVSMAILLWGIMMVLVLVTVAFMWVFQIHFMERNYINSNISEVQTQVEGEGSRIIAYEQGIPVRYYGEEAYLILYHSFSELYTVLDMNRQQLVMLTILLTLISAVLAGVLSKLFTSPILTIKKTVDALKIGQVVRNLLNNAINHTKDGETIAVSVERDRQGCLVRVVNPGEPIPEEDRAVIWERYQRSQHQAGRRQGTGIGLSIVKTILDAHGMTCGVDCREELTCFWFRCPAEHI